MSTSQKDEEKMKAEREQLATPWFALCFPFLIALIVLFASPNFQDAQGSRDGPFGGDFIQEWIGGHVAAHEPSRLYDLEYVVELQHDSQLVGFEWPDEQYFPMVYPPFYYAAMIPISKLSFPVAAKLWLFLSAAALSLTGCLMYRFYPPSRSMIGFGLFACILFVPLLSCFGMGQKATFILLILTCSFLLTHHERPLLGGLVFGLIAFKPHLGIVIGLSMLLKGQWKFAFGALATVAVLVGGSWVWQPELWSNYLSVVSKMGDYVQIGGYQLADSHSLWGATQLALGHAPPMATKVTAAILGLVVIALLWRVLRGTMVPGDTRFAVQFSAMILTMIMLSPHFYSYDLVVLLLPMVLIGSSFSSKTGNAEPDADKSSSESNETSSMARHRAIKIVRYLLIALFILGGLYQMIALKTAVQPSILLMVGVLVVLPACFSGDADTA